MDGSKIKIVVATRGWVYIGPVDGADGHLVITGGSVVRRWGTDRGLGELANSGPLSNTILDPAPVIRIPKDAVVSLFDVNEEVWRGKTG